MLCHSFKSCALPPSLLFHALPEPHLGPQCCLYSLLEGQQENSWLLGGKYCIISNPPRYSALHLPCFLQHVQHQHLPVNPLGWETGTQCLLEVHLLASLQRQLGFLRIMFATLGVSPAGRLGRNPYYSSKSYKHIPGSNLHSTFMEHLVCCLLLICS